MSKIKNIKQILGLVGKFKRRGKKIVTINGSFDLLHVGHIASLIEAKKQGDILIVLINSDRSVKMYKGPNRPILEQSIRALSLAALAVVDYVVIFNRLTPISFLEKIKPDIHCNSSEWGKNCVERKAVEDGGGKIHLIHTQVRHFSTSKMIEKIAQDYLQPSFRAVYLPYNELAFASDQKESFKILQRLREFKHKIFLIVSGSGAMKPKIGKTNKLEIIRDKNFKNAISRSVARGNLNLSKSYLISSRHQDIILGRQFNMKTVKIGNKLDPDLKLQAQYNASTLAKSLKIVFNNISKS